MGPTPGNHPLDHRSLKWLQHGAEGEGAAWRLWCVDASVMAWKWRKVSIKVIWLVVEPTLLKNISQIGSFPQVGMKMKNIWNHHLVIFWLFYIPYPGKWHPIIHQGIIIVNNRRGICCFGGELLFFWNMLVGRHNLLWELCNAHEYFRGAKVAEVFHNFPASILQIRTHP